MIFTGLLIFFLFFLFSCWDSMEFESHALIKGIGIDFTEENRIKFTVQMVKPVIPGEGEVGEENVTWTESITAFSLFEAARNLVKITGRRPLYSHLTVIVFGEEVARSGIAPFLDFFNREPQFRRRSSLIIARGEAADIMEAPHGLEIIAAKGIKDIIGGESILGTSFDIDLRKFTISLLNQTTDPVAGKIELRPGGPENGNESENNLLFVEGAAIFKGDQLVDFLTRKEARGLNWILDPDEIRGPVIIEVNGEKISVGLTQTGSKIIPELEGEKLKVILSADITGTIEEDMTSNYKIMVEENIEQLNKRFAQVVNNEIYHTLQKSREHSSDIFGLGEALYRSHPREFLEIKDDWDNNYKDLQVEIEVDANIARIDTFKEGTGKYF